MVQDLFLGLNINIEILRHFHNFLTLFKIISKSLQLRGIHHPPLNLSLNSWQLANHVFDLEFGDLVEVLSLDHLRHAVHKLDSKENSEGADSSSRSSSDTSQFTDNVVDIIESIGDCLLGETHVQAYMYVKVVLGGVLDVYFIVFECIFLDWLSFHNDLLFDGVFEGVGEAKHLL